MVVLIRHRGFYVKFHCSRIRIAHSLLDTIPHDTNDSKLHSQALPQQKNKLNRDTTHTSSDVYVDSESGDEQCSINLKETPFDNIIKRNNSKTNSLSSHIEEPTSDLQSQSSS